MLATGIPLVGLQYSLGNDFNNAKITVKLAVIITIIVVARINRKRETVARWVIPALGILTVVNIVLATVWKPNSGRARLVPVEVRPEGCARLPN